MKKTKTRIVYRLCSVNELSNGGNKLAISIFFYFLFALFIAISDVFAANVQTPDSLISIEPSQKLVKASNEELVDLTLKVVNRKKTSLNGFIYTDLESTMNSITKNKIAIDVQPGDSLFIPIKVFITKKITSGKDHVIRFTLLNSENILMLTTETKVQISIKREMSMFSLLSSILLDSNLDSIRIPIRISNPGNNSQNVTLVNRFPAFFQNQSFHSTMDFILEPFSDTLITISKPVTRKMYASEGFDVTITGLYSNGDVFGVAYLKVQSGRSDRAYQNPLELDSYNANSISISSQGLLSNNKSFLIFGQGSLELKSGKLDYSLDYTRWQDSYSLSQIRNTWISYESNNMGITAGNINKNLDINLSGRGVSFFLNNAKNNDNYEIGYLDGNSNLIGQNFYSFIPKAAWANYTKKEDNYEVASSLIYEVNPLSNSNSFIFGNTYKISKFKDLRIQANLSIGNTSRYDSTSVKKGSIASGLSISGTIKKISINSSNYFSTAFFPGLRRGAISLNERLTWLREKSNIWLNFDFNSYAPKNFSYYQLNRPVFNSMRAEMGISGTIFKKIISSFSPLFFKESNNLFPFSESKNIINTLTYWNINASLNYPIANNHYLSINTESGFYNTTFDDKTRIHYRSNLNYRKGIFNLNSTVQFGTFYIGEAVSQYLRKQETLNVFSIVPTIRKSFFSNKLQVEAGLAYTNNSLYGNSSFLTARVEYDILSKTSFYSMLNHNRFNEYQYSFLELGLTQKLSLPKVGTKDSELEVFVYRDLNQNNIFDQGDVRAENHLIYINNIVFISSSSGSVVYKKLPLDNYTISIANAKGWYAPDRSIKLEKKKHRVEIPLKKTGTLKGNLAFSFDEFSYEISRNLNGVVVYATDENNVRYITKANLDGHINFYIPIGKYKLSVDAASLPHEVEVDKNIPTVTVNDESPQHITISLIIKQRKIETKKFLSPNAFLKKQ